MSGDCPECGVGDGQHDVHCSIGLTAVAMAARSEREAGGVVGDPVNHPSHYTWLPTGLEVIDITKHFNFVLGNALKYIMRAGRKGGADSELEDLKKAR